MINKSTTNKRMISTEPLRKKRKYDHNEITRQTLKLKEGNITINDNLLKKSSTDKKFFEKYEIGQLIAEGGHGAVFKGKIKFK